MLLLFRKDGHRFTFFSSETPARRYLYAALVPVGIALVLFLIRSLISIEPSAEAPVFGSWLAFILWMPFGAVGEELGWRGYLHKSLATRTRLPGLLSSLLVGFLWMPIHVTFLTRGPVFVLLLILLIISYAIVIYALVQDTQFNVLLASVFHLSINLTNLLFLDVIYETSFMFLNSLGWTVAAVVTVVMKKEIFFTSRQ
jgi:membrane protease YdiL (CAAX protease family)